jgi:hypothetical protein
MKSYINKSLLISILIVFVAFLTLSWGVVGHLAINKAAVMNLPKPIQIFFYNHIDFITEESTIPDVRKSVLQDKSEAPKHYFDMENFGVIDSFPKTMEALKLKYDEKFLSKNGTLPWYIQEMMVKLTNAFKEKNKSEILFIAADLAHYLGDAHMPLHTTDNYDGQKTNQKGIHSLWESRLPELFINEYRFNIEKPNYIENVEKKTWEIIFDTHSLIEPLLAADKKLRTSTPENKIFEIDAEGKLAKNKYNSPIYSDEYARQFHHALNGMVEIQMKKAIVATSSFWYTAWINAGKPDLSDLDANELTQRNARSLKKDLKLFNNAKLFGMVIKSEN